MLSGSDIRGIVILVLFDLFILVFTGVNIRKKNRDFSVKLLCVMVLGLSVFATVWGANAIDNDANRNARSHAVTVNQANNSAMNIGWQFNNYETKFVTSLPKKEQKNIAKAIANSDECEMLENGCPDSLPGNWAGVPTASDLCPLSQVGNEDDPSPSCNSDSGYDYDYLLAPKTGHSGWIPAWIGFCHLTAVGNTSDNGGPFNVRFVNSSGQEQPFTYALFLQYVKNPSCGVTTQLLESVDAAWYYKLDYAGPN